MAINLKAQATIEFLLVMMMMLIYLQTFILPSQNTSVSAITDAKRMILAETAIEKIGNAINEVIVFDGETRKNLTIFIEKNITIKCNTDTNTRISFEVELENTFGTLHCPNNVCSKTLTLPIAIGACFDQISGLEKKIDLQVYKNSIGNIEIKKI